MSIKQHVLNALADGRQMSAKQLYEHVLQYESVPIDTLHKELNRMDLVKIKHHGAGTRYSLQSHRPAYDPISELFC